MALQAKARGLNSRFRSLMSASRCRDDDDGLRQRPRASWREALLPKYLHQLLGCLRVGGRASPRRSMPWHRHRA